MSPEEFTNNLAGFIKYTGGRQPTLEEWAKIKEDLDSVFVKKTGLKYILPPPTQVHDKLSPFLSNPLGTFSSPDKDGFAKFIPNIDWGIQNFGTPPSGDYTPHSC